TLACASRSCDLNWRRNSSRSCSTTAVSGIGSGAGCAILGGALGTTGETRSLCWQVGQTSRSAGKYRWHFAHGKPYPATLRGESGLGSDEESLRRVLASFARTARAAAFPAVC